MEIEKKGKIITTSMLLITILFVLPIYIILKKESNRLSDLMNEALLAGSIQDYAAYFVLYSRQYTFLLFSLSFPFFIVIPLTNIVSGFVRNMKKLRTISYIHLIINIFFIGICIYLFLSIEINNDSLLLALVLYLVANQIAIAIINNSVKKTS